MNTLARQLHKAYRDSADSTFTMGQQWEVVADKAVELLTPLLGYRLLERGKDTVAQGDEWRNTELETISWLPIISTWVGAKEWNATAEFRRKVGSSDWDIANAKIHTLEAGIKSRDAALQKLGAELEDKTATIRRLREKLESVEHLTPTILGEQLRNDLEQTRDAWNKDHMEMKRKLDTAAAYIECLERDVAMLSNGQPKTYETETDTDTLKNQRDNWEQTAVQHFRNEQYYRGLLVQIGELFGLRMRICDDGSVCEGVLVDALPNQVKRLFVCHEMLVRQVLDTKING